MEVSEIADRTVRTFQMVILQAFLELTKAWHIFHKGLNMFEPISEHLHVCLFSEHLGCCLEQVALRAVPLVPGRISGVLGRIGGCPTLVTLNVDQPPFQSVVTHLQRLRCVASSTCLISQAKPYKAVRVLIGQPLSCNYILVDLLVLQLHI